MARRRRSENLAVSQRVQVAFGKRLQAKRRSSTPDRRTQQSLADTLDVSRTSVSNIERGRHRVFLDQVYLAARALGVAVADLLPDMDEVFVEHGVAVSIQSGVDAASLRQVNAIAQDIIAGRSVSTKSNPMRKRR